jgi:putative peptidoglycan lipid II flippase
LGPALGVFFGAMAHFLIQLPLAVKLGFRFKLNFSLSKQVRKIGKLAAPRVLEVSFLQVQKLAELFFASLISTAAYTYFTFGNSLQLLPVGLFGTSIAKAALPTLSREEDKPSKFRKTFLSSLYEIVFLVLPLATILVVLRIPVVRLVYGTDIFGWEATVQTSMVLSAFGFGVVFHAAVALLARSFYALNDTKTPVVVSIISIALSVVANFIFIKVFNLPAWGLAAAFSLGAAFQAIVLFYLINKRIIKRNLVSILVPIFKSVIAALSSGAIMYFLLKFFDKSVWIKRLGLLGQIEGIRSLNFERFVLDTRYTLNLLILTLVVSFIGAVIYLVISFILKNDQLWTFVNLIQKVVLRRKVDPVPDEETETVAPTPADTTT